MLPLKRVTRISEDASNTTGPYIQRTVRLTKLCSRDQTAEIEERFMKPGRGFIWNLIGKLSFLKNFSVLGEHVTIWTAWSTSGSREEKCGKDGMYFLLK